MTIDATTAAWSANTVKTLALATPYTVTADGYFYIGIMIAAATVPTLNGPTLLSVSIGGIAPIVNGNDATNTGLTTPATAPATAAALTATGQGFYAYVS